MKELIGGCYVIINKINNKCYIGSTINLHRRLTEHKTRLKGNYHSNKHLQSSWNKYGADNFEFNIMIRMENKDLLIFEENYIKIFNPEYNKTNQPTSSIIHNPIEKTEKVDKRSSEEFRRKISLALIGRKQSKESIAKMLKTKSERIYVFTDEMRKRLSDSRKGKPMSPERIQKAKNTKASPEYYTKTFQPIEMLNKDTGEVITTFKCIRDALKYLNIKSYGNIYAVIKGKRNYAHGYKWRHLQKQYNSKESAKWLEKE